MSRASYPISEKGRGLRGEPSYVWRAGRGMPLGHAACSRLGDGILRMHPGGRVRGWAIPGQVRRKTPNWPSAWIRARTRHRSPITIKLRRSDLRAMARRCPSTRTCSTWFFRPAWRSSSMSGMTASSPSQIFRMKTRWPVVCASSR